LSLGRAYGPTAFPAKPTLPAVWSKMSQCRHRQVKQGSFNNEVTVAPAAILVDEIEGMSPSSLAGHDGDEVPTALLAPDTSIHIAVNTNAAWTKVRSDRLTATHFPRQTRSGPVQGRNALGGNTGSEPALKGLASSDLPSLSRWIGHTPYIAHHDIEP
jgi:hypothetical protein